MTFLSSIICVVEVPQLTQDGGVTIPLPASAQAPAAFPPPVKEAAVDELPLNSSISSVLSSEPPSFESTPLSLPAPTSAALPVPTFVNGCRNANTSPMLQTSQDFDTDIIDGDLDDLLDSAGLESPVVSELFFYINALSSLFNSSKL